MATAQLITKKEIIAQKKAKLEKQEKMLREKERKIRIKRLIDLGELISKAGIEDLDNKILLGAFLEIKDQAVNQQAISRWGKKADECLKKDQLYDPQRLLILFKSELSAEIKKSLRDHQFRWNSFRKEWWGYGRQEEIETILKNQGADVEITQIQD